MTAKKVLLLTISAAAVFAAFFGIKTILAAPTCGTGGVCSVLTTDGSGNFGIGANSDTVSRLIIESADTSTTKNGLRIVSSDGSTPVFVVRNDGLVTLASSTSFANAGLVFPDGSKQVVAFTGAASSISAGNVSAGSFGSNVGEGNFSFPANVGIGTVSLQPGYKLTTAGGIFVNATSSGQAIYMNAVNSDGGYLGAGGMVSNAEFGLYGSNDEVIALYDSENRKYYYGYNAIVIDPGNNYVGIGTSEPQYPLDVYGASNKLGLSYSYTATYGSTGGELSADSTGNLHIIATKRFPAVVASNILLAENGGKVGIATTTPTYPLTVAGVIHSSTGGYRFPDGTTQTTAATAGTNYFTLSGTNLYPTSTTYNVGIGTSTPAAKLSVNGTAHFNNTISIKGSTGVDQGYVSYSSSPSKMVIYGASSMPLSLGANNAFDKLYINTTGNVGIATTTPTYPLTVAGTIYSSTGGYRFPDGTTQTTAATAGTNYFTLSGTNLSPTSTAYNLGIGTASPSTKLHVVGSSILGSNTVIDPDSYSSTVVAGNIADGSGWGAVGIGGNMGTGHSWTIGKTGGAGGSLYFGMQNGSANDTMQNYMQFDPNRNIYLVPTSGNVGIGTTTPAYGLVVSKTSANPIIAGYSAGAANPVSISIGRTSDEARFAVAAGAGQFATDAAAGDLVIRTESNTNSVRILGGAGATVLQVTSSTVSVVGGTGKINVGTVDPPYTINGEQYATYMAGMTGQKEETTGEISLVCHSGLDSESGKDNCSASIDFDSQEKGSDLWLFAKTTNLAKQMNKMTVLLTSSFDGKVWYEKDAKNNVLKIFATPSEALVKKDDSGYFVSYRLTAPRFDADKWLNTRNEKDVPGLIINY